ncbi:hypothetical protein [uncultured Rikenella sp.]|nr:hypothetical protein [uncultured Rikenella sp.]
MWNLGASGYNWSSSINSTNGMFLAFGSQGLDSNNASNRAHGFQLRCLSE